MSKASGKHMAGSIQRLVMRRVISSSYKNSMTGRHMLVCQLECGHSQTVKCRHPAPKRLGCVECQPHGEKGTDEH